MKLTIEIELDNAAFKNNCGAEVAWILGNIALPLEAAGWSKTLIDHNGNSVGVAVIEDGGLEND